MGRLASAIRSSQRPQMLEHVTGTLASVSETKVTVTIDDVENVMNGWSDAFHLQIVEGVALVGRKVMVDVVLSEDTSSELFVAYAIVIGSGV